MAHFKGPRPRYWEEWEAFSRTSKRAVIVYQHNRCRRAALNRDHHLNGGDSWPYETLWYYLKGVRYWVSIYWSVTPPPPCPYHSFQMGPAPAVPLVPYSPNMSPKELAALYRRLADALDPPVFVTTTTDTTRPLTTSP